MTGSCLCGAIKYEIVGRPSNGTVCHCDGCRRASGAPAVAWLTVPRDAWRVSGSLRYVVAPNPRQGTCDGCCTGKRGFCPICGSQISFEDDRRANQVDITVGTLDDPASFEPTEDVFAEHRLPWVKPFAQPTAVADRVGT